MLDSKGRYVGRILPQKRYWVSINRIPAFLQQALVAIEDSRFYEHGGIDYRGIARAAVTDVIKGKMAQGGSTITQQLIKNKYLNSAKTLNRKIKEELSVYMAEDPKTIERALKLMMISLNLERIADLATNIAEDVIYIATGQSIKHGRGRAQNADP